MNFKFLSAILAGKLCIKLLNVFGSSATALPGLIILKLYPRFLEETIGRYPEKIILVTGTNGKTTTAHLLTHLLRKSGKRVFHNPEGSNMERGIASEVLKQKNINFDFFVLESDEGTFPHLLQKLKTRTVILLNIFRDQLDRYGEINSLMDKWRDALEKNPPEKIIFNADDPNITWIINYLRRGGSPDPPQGQVVRPVPTINGFTVKTHDTSRQTESRNSDRVFCPKCNDVLKFTPNNFYCLTCGFKKIKAKYILKENLPREINNLSHGVQFNNEPIGMPLLGKYNYYNLAAALTAYSSVGARLTGEPLQKLLEDFHPAFGRFEKIKYKNHDFHVILAKNPAGMDNVLQTIFSNENVVSRHCPVTTNNLLMCLNDKIADGEDVSWIYDVDFENLFSSPQQLIFSGTRAHDLALRLKIAEKLPETYIIESNMQTAFEKFLEGVSHGEKSAAIVTYTCLIELQKIMYKKGMIKKIMG